MKRKVNFTSKNLVKHIDRLASAGILPLKKGNAVKPIWYGVITLIPPVSHPIKSIGNVFKLSTQDDIILNKIKTQRGDLDMYEAKQAIHVSARSLKRHKRVVTVPGNTFGSQEPLSTGFNGAIQTNSKLPFNSRIKARALGGITQFKPKLPIIHYPEDELKQIFYSEHPFELARPISMVEDANELNHKSTQNWSQVEPHTPLDLFRRVIDKAHSTQDIRSLYMETVQQFRLHRAQQDVESKLKLQEQRKLALPDLLDKFDAAVAQEVDIWKQKISSIQGDNFTAKHSKAFAQGEIEKIQKRAMHDRLVLLQDEPRPCTESIQEIESVELVENRKLMIQKEKEHSIRKPDF
jgi:hypothetical protein